MQATHTAGAPTTRGSSILPTIGGAKQRRNAPRHRAAANNRGTGELSQEIAGYPLVFSDPVGSRQGAIGARGGPLDGGARTRADWLAVAADCQSAFLPG